MKKNIIKNLLIATFVCISGILTGFLIYKYNSEISALLISATTVKKEAYTELYFQNSEHLPTKPSVISDFTSVPYTFAFTIHNVEGKDVVYHYEVTLSGEKNQTVETANLLLKKGESKTIQETFRLPNAIAIRTKVTVTLKNKNQSISFWIGGTK